MLVKLLCTVLLTLGVSSDESVEIDPVIYYLLNGEYEDHIMPSESAESKEPELDGGLWKCGMCKDIGESRLIYRESNEGDDRTDPSMQIKIEVTLQGMKCVIVRSHSANTVKSVMGDCEGPSVTLTLLPTELFTLDVYGDDKDEMDLDS